MWRWNNLWRWNKFAYYNRGGDIIIWIKISPDCLEHKLMQHHNENVRVVKPEWNCHVAIKPTTPHVKGFCSTTLAKDLCILFVWFNHWRQLKLYQHVNTIINIAITSYPSLNTLEDKKDCSWVRDCWLDADSTSS